MFNGHNPDRARDALYAIPAHLPRDQWVKAGMAFHSAGGNFDTFNDWSAQAPNYIERDAIDVWHSFKPDKGIGAGTLYMMAADHGRNGGGAPQRPPAKLLETPSTPRPGMNAAEIWARCEAAATHHPYIISKAAAGVPLDNLRVVPSGDPLIVASQCMVGYLVVPACKSDGTLQSLQFIPPPGIGKKLNLPGATMSECRYVVGDIMPSGLIYICEGVGAAWSCWQATGNAAVACFGSGNVEKVTAGLRRQYPTAQLVLVPDVGKEADAEKFAIAHGAAVVRMPDGWPQNSDVNDLYQREGADVLETLLWNAYEPPKPPPRYKLLSSSDLASLQPPVWRVSGVLPAKGLAGVYGPSKSGKSFLALDMAAAIAEGRRWFGYRVVPTPVVYIVLEGEDGFRLRARAWETYYGRKLPADLHLVIQPFKLTDSQDIQDMATVIPYGAVLFIDTFNRAAPSSDENSSKDMGEILEAAKHLQSITEGLVVLIHHTGKDATKGLRGHSSLFAAMDAAVEVSRKGDLREWKVAKSKDGADGGVHTFRLQVEALGTDQHGDLVTSCTVRVYGSVTAVQAIKVPQGDNQKLVYSAIQDLLKHASTGKSGAPPLSPCIELEAAVMAGAARLTCTSDKRTTRARTAISGLVSRGVLGANDGWVWAA